MIYHYYITFINTEKSFGFGAMGYESLTLLDSWEKIQKVKNEIDEFKDHPNCIILTFQLLRTENIEPTEQPSEAAAG